MSEVISQVVQTFDPGDLIVLFQLDCTSLGGTTYYFTSTAYSDAIVYFDGVPYVPVDIEASGFEWSGKGALPTPRIRISNASQVVASAVIEFDDLLGAELTRIRTFRQFLDDGTQPDPDAIFPLDVFRVERKSAHNKVFIEWELSSVIDQQGKKLPGRQFLKDNCTHIYRIWDEDEEDFDYTKATCPYQGTDYFTSQDVSTVNPDEDICGKYLSSCRLRFGEHGELPTRAFPGVGRYF